MSAESRNRDEVRWHTIDDLAWLPFEESSAWAGASGRLLSEGDGGSQTWVVRTPRRWTATIESVGVVEIFITGGALLIGGELSRVGGFAGIPSSVGPVMLDSPEESEFLVFLNPQFDPLLCYPDGRVHLVTTRDLPWQVMGERGVAVKQLRQGTAGDTATSPVGFLNILLFLPGFVSDEVEFHNTWEEMVYLDGDFFMVERGNAGTTSYHANPAGALHGPFGTQWGSLMLHHALEPYRTDFSHRPGGLERVAEYLDGTPFDGARPKTDGWAPYAESSAGN